MRRSFDYDRRAYGLSPVRAPNDWVPHLVYREGGAPLARVLKPIRDVIQSCAATEQDNGQLQVRSVLSPEGSHGSHPDHAGADGVNFLQIVRNVKQGEFKFRLEPHDFAG